MLPEGTFDDGLQFVQDCQVAVLACADDDAVAQAVAIWNCLSGFPKSSDADDLAPAAVAVWKIAKGFFESPGEPRRAVERMPSSSGRKHANAVVRLLRQQYREANLTQRHAAEQLDLSQAYLSRILRGELGGAFGSAFRAHLNGIRLLAAIVQLPSGRSFRTIAEEVGYPTTGELDRQFHRWFGVSPRTFRTYLRWATRV